MGIWKRISLAGFSALALGLVPAGAALAQVKVTAATPSSTYQGTTLDVVVTGSGFDLTAKAQYLVSGTTNPGGITVTRVVFRKSTEIVTTIVVTDEADLASFDIVVTLDSGRKGKGTTLFKVQAKPNLTSPGIVPQDLGTSGNCQQSYGLGINNGTNGFPLQVVGQGSYCNESAARPTLWTASTGMLDLGTIGSARGGGAIAVSDDGTVVGILNDGANLGFVRSPGGPMEGLPGLVPLKALDVAANGAFIVATDGNDVGARWDRAGGSWQPTFIPSGTAVAVSDSGAVVGHVPVPGSINELKARIWAPSGSVELPGDDTRVNDIDARGVTVVGFRRVETACKRRPCPKYSVPMVWTLVDGNWVAKQLVSLNSDDCEATGVAEVNGETVIVGNGRDPTLRAVYWKRDDVTKQFSDPIRLGGLGGDANAFSRAEGVNSGGQIVGYSGVTTSNSSTTYAVIWQLP
jgi:uncharacterized membrane protein